MDLAEDRDEGFCGAADSCEICPRKSNCQKGYLLASSCDSDVTVLCGDGVHRQLSALDIERYMDF